MKHLIIGAGAAALSAVRRILAEKPEDQIVIVSQDEEVYSRCMLHKYISGERDAQSLNFVNDDILSSPNVLWIKGITITRLDGATKTVYTGEQAVASGDTILIATGSTSITPPIGDLQTAKNAFGLRHLSDARDIVDCATKSEKIAVIGAGLVGLDAVYGLIDFPGDKKKDISVIEMAPSTLAINLDAHAAEAYQRLFEQHGVHFHLASKVVNTVSSDGNITALELEGGELVPCDMVIVAVGVRPAAAFLDGSGVALTERRAIQVDDYLATTVPGIYAAGDVAGLSGIWPNAQKQGETAAYNMTGTQWAYNDRFSAKNTINFFGLLSLSLGEINPQEGDKVLIQEDRNNYRKLILRDGAPVGIILQGEIGSSGYWQHLIKNKIIIDNLGKSPWKVSYADFYNVVDNGEFMWAM